MLFIQSAVGFACGPGDLALVGRGMSHYILQLTDDQGVKSLAVIGATGVEQHRLLALGAKITNFIQLNLLNNPDQVGAVGELAVVVH